MASLETLLRQVASTAATTEQRGLLLEAAGRARVLEVKLVLAREALGTTPFDDVRAFSERFGFGPPGRPTKLDLGKLGLRKRLVREETEELCLALDQNDLGAIAQEGADLLYVTYGAFVDCGIRPEPVWEAVHRANMAKIPNPSGGKVLKPAGWQKPNCAKLVEEQGA